ncbi:MipA/OmpV family protein [Massilia pinisoli]|uniref:MipA/OmpV family protein n=1 Tax=Massilia pinisoli TaxID=1772194 RepID=A0ABT1ZQN5_9BURK|nr:MipA/OmpV family protein [Massilia pinisoli]MCS0582224.1 MipA/OmpV family protein [Massilia pinisoli]
MPTLLRLALPLPLLIALPAAAADGDARTVPLWEAGVGAAVFSTPAYPASSDRSTRGIALPFLLYRGKVLRVDQGGVGARLLNTDRVEFDVGFAAALPAYSKDVEARRGMPDLGTLVEFGPRVKYKFADLGDAGRLRAELPVRAVIEGRGGFRRQGWTTEPRLVWEQRGDGGRWTLETQLGAVFGDRRIHRYFYEVAPQYATADRPAYRADGGLMLVRTGVFGTLRVNPDVRVFGFVRLDSYAGNANRDSPLFEKKAGVSAGVGFAWTLARSTRSANE